MDEGYIKHTENRAKENYNFMSKIFSLDKYISKDKNHLDFGCGLGIFVKLLSDKYQNANFVGIDQDKERIRVSKERYRNKNLSFICSKNISKKFDSISATYVLHEIKDTERALKIMYKSLNKKGIIMIYDFRKSSKKDFKKLYKRGRWDGDFKEEYNEHNRWSLKKFKKMARGAGFNEIKLKPIGKHFLVYIGEKK